MPMGFVVALVLLLFGARASAQTPAANPGYVKGARSQFAVVQTLVMLSAEIRKSCTHSSQRRRCAAWAMC